MDVIFGSILHSSTNDSLSVLNRGQTFAGLNFFYLWWTRRTRRDSGDFVDFRSWEIVTAQNKCPPGGWKLLQATLFDSQKLSYGDMKLSALLLLLQFLGSLRLTLTYN